MSLLYYFNILLFVAFIVHICIMLGKTNFKTIKNTSVYLVLVSL